VRVAFGSRVAGFSVHLGNSPTNDGYGGDQGTTPDSAEAYLLERQLSVFTAVRAALPRVDRLLDVVVPSLVNRTMEFEVCDQALGVEVLPDRPGVDPLKWRLETASSRLLFSLGPTPAAGKRETGGSIYAGFNRVIHRTTGAASHARFGSGVRRVEISLIP
jgi:hypothetical protein